MITTATWVPRGFAAPFPSKYKFDEDEFERIAELAKLQLDDAKEDLEEAEEAAAGAEEDEDEVNGDKSEKKKKKSQKAKKEEEAEDEDNELVGRPRVPVWLRHTDRFAALT
jgi:periodic tryptophan protein 1